MAATIEYAIRSKDQSKAGVASAEAGINKLKKSVEGFTRILTGTFLGGSTLMAVRQIVQFGSASIQAAKDAGLLTPELDKITNGFKDLKIAVGAGLAEGLKGAFASMNEGMKGLQGDKIATAVSGTIEKIGQAFKLLWDLVWTTGSGVFVRVFVFLAKVGLQVVRALFDAFKALFGQIELIWKNVAYAVKSVWVIVINWIIDRLNDVLNLYNNSGLAKFTHTNLGQIGRPSTDLGPAPGAIDIKKITAPFGIAFKNIEGLTVEFGEGIVDSFRNLYQDVLDLLKPPATVTMPAPPGLPAPGYGNMPTFGAGAAPAGSPTSAPAPGLPAGPDAAGAFVMSLLSGAAGSIGMVVQAILNPLTLLIPVFNGLMSVLGPVADAVLAPLIGILTILGKVVGAQLVAVFEALAPVIDIIATAFVFLYNYAIMPLANAVIFVVNMIYNLLTGIWNAIAKAINSLLGWAGVHLKTIAARAWDEGFLGRISESDLRTAGTEGTAAGGGAGATYSGAPTYYIYITNNFGTASVIDTSGAWDAFVTKVFREGALLEAARQGA